MEPRSLKYVATACGGGLHGGPADLAVRGVCTDSRHVQPGDLFIALAGERFDAHDYLEDVVKRGAAAIVARKDRVKDVPAGCAVIGVDDTRRALGGLAARYRQDFDLPVIAVAGSNGKTTTKELVASVLSQKMETLRSEASFNNDIGVPLTLLKLRQSHRAAVLEVGTNHPGELAPLVRMVRPQYGIITNIGREHLEFFGGIDGVAEEEGWLAELLPEDGQLFLNGDNDWSPAMAKRTKAKVVQVGLGKQNDWRARDVKPDTLGLEFRVESHSSRSDCDGAYRVGLLGRHQAVNALFALAVGAELGLERADLQKGLAACKPAKMRMHLWDAHGVSVLDDAYNANADSMAAALQCLMELPCAGRRVAVLGDMAELGEHSREAHDEVGRRAAELGVEQIFAVGSMAGAVAAGARAAGLLRVFEFGDVETAAPAVKSFLKPGDLVLLKASRAARLERVAELLQRG